MNSVVGGQTAKNGAKISPADAAEDASFLQEAPPFAVGQSERRMQVRAYNHWAGLLDDRALPPLASLNPQDLADFAPHGVVIDLSSGQNTPSSTSDFAATAMPAIRFLGSRLAEDCGADATSAITNLSQVPERSLLSRLTDQYAQVLSNNAPLSFEGEFANQQDTTVQYRGILLPFSDNGSRVEQIFGVINWREVAGDRLTRSLHKEVNAALQSMPAVQADNLPRATMADWADGPAAGLSGGLSADLTGNYAGDGAVDLMGSASQTYSGIFDTFPAASTDDYSASLAAMSGEALVPSPASLAVTGPEFALVMIRRDEAGQIHLLGEIPAEPALLEQAALALLQR